MIVALVLALRRRAFHPDVETEQLTQLLAGNGRVVPVCLVHDVRHPRGEGVGLAQEVRRRGPVRARSQSGQGVEGEHLDLNVPAIPGGGQHLRKGDLVVADRRQRAVGEQGEVAAARRPEPSGVLLQQAERRLVVAAGAQQAGQVQPRGSLWRSPA